jgi:hypothetical protein
MRLPALLSLALLLAGCHAARPPAGPAEPVVLDPDGGWCWFQDPRAIVHDGVLLVGSVASGHLDSQRRGDIQVTRWDLDSGACTTVELADRLQLDDHDAPALHRRTDGRWLAVYARHGNDDLVRWRVSQRAADATAWAPERTQEATTGGRGVTYSNLYRARWSDVEAVLLDLFRGDGWDPNVLVSRDDGESWERAGRLLGGPGRPYLRYAGDGEAVHFIATEQHPRDLDNSIWHGVLREGRVHASDGTLLGAVGEEPVAPEQLTRVFEGGPDAVAWTVDLELDEAGRPVALFSLQVDGAGLPPGQGGMDHRLGYARWDGQRWRAREVAFAGTRLYAGEDDYTGLGAIDPDHPHVVYLSTDAHPVTGAPLVSAADGERHYELFRGVSADGGASWSWTPLTTDSTADNLRPVVPARSDGRTALLWLRGELRSYTDYDLEIVGLELEETP